MTFLHIVIRGVHTMFYSSEPEDLRVFLRDKLGFSATDIGEGWLIFDLPEADMGVHPVDPTGKHGAPNGTHNISFYCDDIHDSVEQLRVKGVEFVTNIQDEDFGLVAYFRAPGNLILQIYQPKYSR